MKLRRLVITSLGAVAFSAAGILPGAAQFPPQDAVADAANPAIATITTVSPLGVYRKADRFYYDCARKKWVWVSREWSKQGTSPFSSEEFTTIPVPTGQPASPSVKELPSGSPPGARTQAGDPNRAFNPTTGQNLVHRKDNWVDVKTGQVIVAPKLCPEPAAGVAPPPPQPPAPPPQPPESPLRTGMAPPRGAAFNIGNVDVAAATLTVDPAHFTPSTGAKGDQWGFAGSGLFPVYDKLSVELDAGYHRVTTSGPGPGLDNWTAGASLVWKEPDWRFGPSFGFQSNSVGLVSTETYNYGPYVDWFALPYLTLSAKIGDFSSTPAPDGFYVSGGIKLYATPNFVFNGGIDHTRFTSLPSSNETDLTIGAEYLFSETTPISFFGGYTRNQFSPGTFHVNTVLFGLKLYLNGDGATTLVDRQRTGTLGASSLFAPLKLKF